MKFHIVRNHETVKEILNTYSLNINELKEYNRHVRDWSRLIPGTKLKIPIINEAVEQDIIDMEPFIEDYYPRNNEPIFENTHQEDETEELKVESEVENQSKVLLNENIEVSKDKEIKDVKKKLEENQKKDFKEQRNNEYHFPNNIAYIWYQPYPVYYPIYIKVK